MKMILDNSYENRPVRVYSIYSPTLRTGIVFLVLQDKELKNENNEIIMLGNNYDASRVVDGGY